MTTEMATGLADQLQENYLTCQICFDIFQQPKALPCLHSFCLECLNSFIHSHQNTTQNRRGHNQNVFQCPLCRRDVAIPAGGARGFPDNHILISLSDTLNIRQDEEMEDHTEFWTSGEETYNHTNQTVVPSTQQTDTNYANQDAMPSAPPDDSISLYRPTTGRPRTSARRIIMPDLESIENDVHALPGFIRTFGKFGYSLIDMTYPIGLTTTSDGHVVVSDQRDNRILVYDILGNFYNLFQCEGNLRTITAGDNGDSIIVAIDNTGKALAHMYKLNGTQVRSFGNMFGYEHPHGIAYTIHSGIVVSTLDSCVIYTLNKNGKLIQKFGTKGNDITRIMTPYHMTINPKGDILVSDCDCNCIKVFSHVGKFLFHFGGSYNNPQELWYPKGLCVDLYGNVIVADFGNRCVKRFSPTGSLIDTLIEFPSVQVSNQLRPINVALYENKIVVLVVGVYNAQIIVCDYQHLDVQANARSKMCSIM